MTRVMEHCDDMVMEFLVQVSYKALGGFKGGQRHTLLGRIRKVFREEVSQDINFELCWRVFQMRART